VTGSCPGMATWTVTRAFLDQFFKTGKLDGNTLTFTTQRFMGRSTNSRAPSGVAKGTSQAMKRTTSLRAR